jgi:tetratricopeptide (TPR) repeat protein
MAILRAAARTGIGLAATALVSWSQLTYRARIVVEEGVPPPVTPQIIPDRQSQCAIVNLFGNGIVEYATDPAFRSDECLVTIRLAGYRKTDVTLHEGAVVVMNRPGSHANPTVSLATLEAPEKAKRAYEKGVAAMFGKKWEAAQKEFKRAVAIHASYAPAWCALGETLERESKPQEARAAYRHAVKAEPGFAKAWVRLAQLEVAEGRLQDALEAARQAIRLDATGFPAVYAAQAMADLGLDHPDAAEKSARRAVELDTYHEVPRAESALASVLAAKGDREGAIKHWKKYLEMSPKAGDAAEVKRRIADLEAREGKAK